jgi:cell division protein FtsZ
MIPIPRSTLKAGAEPSAVTCIIGIGNAGVALVDALTLAGAADHTRLVAVNTDSVSLSASVAKEKLLIGQKTTRGLGSGGDPELGAQATEEAEAELAAVVDGAGLVILCGGLGGGTASGAAPVIAEIAARANAIVIAVLTLPFSFEGKRRARQAVDALHDISRAANAVITFENDQMSEIAQPMAGLHETFAASDQILADSLAALLRLVAGSGPMKITLADLVPLFRPGSVSARFGTAGAQGGNRANQAVERALKSPLLRDKHLSACDHVVFHIEASSSLRFVEVEAVGRALAAQLSDTSQLHLAVSINDDLADTLLVSVLAGGSPCPREVVAQGKQPERIVAPSHDDSYTEEHNNSLPPPIETIQQITNPRAGDELFNTEPFSVLKDSPVRRNNKPKQETLSLDAIARGRFEKSEPTIVGGEDLDVPTFLRQKIKLR